ncbi:uncharacterized protein EAF02_012173 [Botrytis sinoallii]|uniref:uncharacterized protein n=1 Tax=Botrytis sinoallii TaxID=1463999 RepID=UPI0019009061|nr:uncharacterized protein EAF02_012173 [Botrytis sinoallii]KAF7852586.1 hypothetical protein EAF02_012173 [Botrytis sinoallii]
MENSPSPETESSSDAQQDVSSDQSTRADSLRQSQQMAEIIQHLNGVNGIYGRPGAGAWATRIRARIEALVSSENDEELVGSQSEGEEARQASENHTEAIANSQAEDAEARPLEFGGLPNPPPLIFEDDTMIKRSCYENFRLEEIESYLSPVSAGESDRCPICLEKYNETLHAPTVVKDIRYCNDCQRLHTMRPDTSNSHIACAVPVCSHIFGKHCIIQWLKHHSTCPLCRNRVDLE